MQPIIEENISVASVGKTIASSRWGHREFESRHVKFLTRISRQNKRYTNMDLAIPLGLEFRGSDWSSRTAWVQIPLFTCFYSCKITLFSQFNFPRQLQLSNVDFS